MVATGEGCEPLFAFVEVDVAVAWFAHICAHIGHSHLHGLFKDFALFGAGVEGLALLKADRRGKASQFRVKQADWFPLDDCVQLFKKMKVVGMHRVEYLLSTLDEVHRRWVVFL